MASSKAFSKLIVKFQAVDERVEELLAGLINTKERLELVSNRLSLLIPLPGRLNTEVAYPTELANLLEFKLAQRVERYLEQVRCALEELEVIYRQMQQQQQLGVGYSPKKPTLSENNDQAALVEFGQMYWRKRQLAEAMLSCDRAESFQILLAEWKRR